MPNQVNTKIQPDDLDIFADAPTIPTRSAKQSPSPSAPQQSFTTTSSKIVAPSFVKPHNKDEKPKDSVVPIAVTIARPSKSTYVMGICAIILAVFCLILGFIALII